MSSSRDPPPPSYDQISGSDCKKAPMPESQQQQQQQQPQQQQQQPQQSYVKPGEAIRFGSKLNQIYLSWVPVTRRGQVPARAIEGRDSAGIFVARAHHGYSLLPGKTARQHGCGFASHSGAEIQFADYEVLCDSSIASFGHAAYDWVACDAATVPQGALAGGYTEKAEPLFIARGCVSGERVFGYFAASQRSASFPWGGMEHRSTDFEVLVIR